VPAVPARPTTASSLSFSIPAKSHSEVAKSHSDEWKSMNGSRKEVVGQGKKKSERGCRQKKIRNYDEQLFFVWEARKFLCFSL
jgi:hypothetical protein